MEDWKVDEVHIERETSDHAIETCAIACEAVTFNPTSSPAESVVEAGCLRVRGTTIDALPWTPTRIRFKAHRYLEERLFEVGGYDVEPGCVVFFLPAGEARINTNAADGHINHFKSSTERG